MRAEDGHAGGEGVEEAAIGYRSLAQRLRSRLRKARREGKQEGEAHLKANLRFVQLPEADYRNELRPMLETALGLAQDTGNAAWEWRLRKVLQLWEAHLALCTLLLQRLPDGKRAAGDRKYEVVLLTEAEVAQVRRRGQECLRLAHELGWRLTPWLHVLWAHSGQLCEKWASLWMFGCWGLEGRHRLVKKFYDVSLKATRQKRTGQLGVGMVLHRCVVRTALKRLPDHRILRHRAPGYAAAAVRDAKQRAMALLRGPGFAAQVADLVRVWQ